MIDLPLNFVLCDDLPLPVPLSYVPCRHVELGNSGVFRPEMLLPMGFPEDVTVIAWGLSLERPTMIKYGYGNIRELEGYGFDLKMSMDHPIVRLNETELAH